jgi:hypothetical protein
METLQGSGKVGGYTPDWRRGLFILRSFGAPCPENRLYMIPDTHIKLNISKTINGQINLSYHGDYNSSFMQI